MASAQGHQTRERLVRAAMEAFAERGYRGTSLNAVAAKTGITRQGLLHYFPTKTDLLMAVLDQRDDDDRAYADTVTKAQEPDLSTLLLGLGQRREQQPELARLFAVAAAESVLPNHPAHDYFRHRYDQVLGEMVAAVERERSRGGIAPEVQTEQLAIALLALLSGLNLHALLRPDIDAQGALASVLRLVTGHDTTPRDDRTAPADDRVGRTAG